MPTPMMAKSTSALNIRCTFHNFVRGVARKIGPTGIIWANLYCFDWEKGLPERNEELIESIKHYSGKLLKAQIKVLKPDIIIFANGTTSVPFRRKLFPIKGENNVCLNLRDYSSFGVQNKHLWEFNLDGLEFDFDETIRCFRIQHPSACGRAARDARSFLIDMLNRETPT